jgi:hypothetical protein
MYGTEFFASAIVAEGFDHVFLVPGGLTGYDRSIAGIIEAFDVPLPAEGR